MALNTAFTGMPWLGQPGDAGQSLQQGASAGAAIAAAAARRSEGRLRAAQMQHLATIDLAEEERRKQQYAEQAEQAAIRAEGIHGLIEKHERTGIPIPDLVPEFAPKMYYGSPSAMQHFFSNLQSVEQRREAAEALGNFRSEMQERLSEKDRAIEGFREREVKLKEEAAKERSERIPAESQAIADIEKLEDQEEQLRRDGKTAEADKIRKRIEFRRSAVVKPSAATKPTEAKLSQEDAAAMKAEMDAVIKNDELEGDALLNAIERIRAKYESRRKGVPDPSVKRFPWNPDKGGLD